MAPKHFHILIPGHVKINYMPRGINHSSADLDTDRSITRFVNWKREA
jgi:hypothetical protein